MNLQFELRPCSEMVDGQWYVVGRFRFLGVDFIGYYTPDNHHVIYCDTEVF